MSAPGSEDPLVHAADVMGRVVVVTGTDTDVGKSYATAALVVAGHRSGRRRIAVVKPAQTGVRGDDPGDVHTVARLAAAAGVPPEALTLVEAQRLAEPLAPPPAAAIDGVELPSAASHVARVERLLADHDLVLVEGSGGVLVELDGEGRTIADLAAALTCAVGDDVGTVVVCRPDLGTLNHTLLTLEALERRRIRVLGMVLGRWPAEPTLLHETNRTYLRTRTDAQGRPVPLLGTVPDGWGAAAARRPELSEEAGEAAARDGLTRTALPAAAVQTQTLCVRVS